MRCLVTEGLVAVTKSHAMAHQETVLRNNMHVHTKEIVVAHCKFCVQCLAGNVKWPSLLPLSLCFTEIPELLNYDVDFCR